MLHFDIPSDLAVKFSSCAAALGQKEEALLSRVIADFIEEMEDSVLAEERLAQGNPRLNMNDMRERLGLAKP